jgi:hypothetical protein
MKKRSALDDIKCAITVADLKKLLKRKRRRGCAVQSKDLEKHLKRRKKKR